MKKSTIQRQRLIADFIDSESVSSQNQLKGLLKKNNIQITQATLSRDLNELGAIKKQPVVIESDDGDSIAIRSMMMLTLGFDHRLIDGAGGSRFLERKRYNLESMDLDDIR